MTLKDCITSQELSSESDIEVYPSMSTWIAETSPLDLNDIFTYGDCEVISIKCRDGGDRHCILIDPTNVDITQTKTHQSMTVDSYSKRAMRTIDTFGDRKRLMRASSHYPYAIPQLINGCLGLSGETGEVVDIIKKYIFHETELNRSHLIKELGDVAWYLNDICDALDISLEDVLRTNTEKLNNRYPNGFNTVDANHRKEGDI